MKKRLLLGGALLLLIATPLWYWYAGRPQHRIVGTWTSLIASEAWTFYPRGVAKCWDGRRAHTSWFNYSFVDNHHISVIASDGSSYISGASIAFDGMDDLLMRWDSGSLLQYKRFGGMVGDDGRSQIFRFRKFLFHASGGRLPAPD